MRTGKAAFILEKFAEQNDIHAGKTKPQGGAEKETDESEDENLFFGNDVGDVTAGNLKQDSGQLENSLKQDKVGDGQSVLLVKEQQHRRKIKLRAEETGQIQPFQRVYFFHFHYTAFAPQVADCAVCIICFILCGRA